MRVESNQNLSGPMSATDQAQNKLQDWSVSLIIVNHNSSDRLVQCVRSVFAANADLEVIVVDNATTDSSLAQLEAAFPADPRLRIMEALIYFQHLR